MRIKLSTNLTRLLKRDLLYIDFALKTLREEMLPYEKKYSMNWEKFISKFEKGELGDDKVWFDWYGLALGTKDWYDTKKEIEQAIGTS